MAATQLHAFSGTGASRADALQRLQAHIDAKQVTAGVMFWNGTQGSVSGCLVDSNDPAVWQERLGLAPWLACAIDVVTGVLPPATAVGMVMKAFEAIETGSDTTLLGSRVVCAVLAQLPPAPGGEARQALLALHQRLVSGDAPTNSEWRAARKLATAATDAAAAGEDKVLCECTEAAAWDPSTSPTSVGDVLRLWANFLSCNIDRELDWTEEKNQLVQRRLNEMHKTYIEPNPEEKRSVFQLLEVHDPDLEAQVRSYMKSQGRIRQWNAERAGAILLETLGAQA